MDTSPCFSTIFTNFTIKTNFNPIALRKAKIVYNFGLLSAVGLKLNGYISMFFSHYFYYYKFFATSCLLPLVTKPNQKAELQIIFTVVSVFTKENFNPFSNLISPFGIGTHEIQWLFSIFLTHNWSPIYLLL